MYQLVVLLLSAKSFKRRTLSFLILPFVCLLPQSGYSQNPEIQKTTEVTKLESAVPIERELAGGQKHTYQITLSANEYKKVVVLQRGVDLIVRVFDTNEKLKFVHDAEMRPQGAETLQLSASTATDYRIVVEPKQKYAPASRYEIRVAEVRPATGLDHSLQEATSLLVESTVLTREGKYKEALAKAESALKIRENALGAEHGLVGLALNRMGMLYFDLGNHAESEVYLRRALAVHEKQTTHRENLDIADTLNNLAVLHDHRGEYTEAEAIYKQVLAIREQELGLNHTYVAATLNNLGVNYRRRGNHAQARQMYERSLEIRERTLGKNSPEVAMVLKNLAALSYYSGDYATALELDLRVLEIREKEFGAEHPAVANDLSYVALIYADSGQPDKAEPLYQRALKIYEKTVGLDHLDAANTFNSLGKLYLQQGDFAKAEPLLLRSVQIAEKHLGNGNVKVANYLQILGDLYSWKGDYEQAEAVFKRTLEIREKILGDDHYYTGGTCNALAKLYALKGDLASAVKFQARANQISEKHTVLNLAIGTEHQKLSYMSMVSEGLNQTIALHTNLGQKDLATREQAVTAVLRRKGRVLDAMTGSLTALRRRLNAQDQILFDKLMDANARLSELALNKPKRSTVAEYQQQIAEIQERKDKLEAEISRRSAGFYEIAKPVSLADVRALIPDNAALVEFAVYKPLAVKPKDEKSLYDKPRYIAYVVRRNGEVQWKELGDAEDIDAAVNGFRQALRDKNRQDVRQLARAVDERVMQSVRTLAGDASHLLISPDGELNLIPFEALADEKGNYLIENYQFTYLTSGRDLLRMQAGRESKNKPLVIANPSYGAPAAEQIAKVNLTNPKNLRRSVTVGDDLSDVYFVPLGGAAQEARSIQTLFPEATFLTGTQASEAALKQAASPRFLHIATHGFFLQDALNDNAKIENPLLRAGLALTGANRRSSDGSGEDGILTALEASGLNLWGTKLVVLSSCDTGVGEVKNREGVYGLRRAFVQAGADSMVMSMWAVSDYMTRDLMTNYYQNLKQGMGRGSALRQSQLEMLKRKDRQHPFYWASFIQSGEWANLDGKR